MTFSAYSIAVRLSLVENVTHGLTGMAKFLASTGREVENLQGKLSAIKGLALGGAALFGVGAFGLAGLRAATNEAEKFQTAVANLKTLGIGDAATADAVKFVKAMGVMGVSWTDKMNMFTEAQGIFRDSGMKDPAERIAAAKFATPLLAQMHFANLALHPDKAGQMDANELAMLRFIDMKGAANNPAKFKELMTAGYKSIQASGGSTNWEQYRQFMARAGVAGQGLSTMALFAEMEPVISEMKGGTAGFATRTAFQRLTGAIKVPNQVAHALVQAGVWDASKIQWNSAGGIKQFTGDGIPLKDMELFHQSQFQWYQKYMMPFYAQQHYSGAQMDHWDSMFGGSTGGAMFSIFRRQQAVIERSRDAWAKGYTPEQAAQVAAGTLRGKRIQAGSQWRNVKEAAGEAILPLAVSALGALVPVLQSIANFSIKHPGMFKTLILGFAGLSVMATVAGSILMVRAAFMALSLVFNLVGGPGGALTLIGRGFAFLAPWLVRLVPWVLRLAAGFLEMIGPIGWTVLAITALVAFWPQLSAMFKGMLSWLKDIFHVKSGQTWNDVKPNFGQGGPERGPSPFVPGPRDMQAFALHGTVHIDGKKVGGIVSGHQAQALGQTKVGVVRHDPSATPAAAGAGAGR